jgi:hypothetical protein
VAALAVAASMAAVSMAADLAAAGAAAAGAAVGVELAGEAAVGAEVVGGGVDRRSSARDWGLQALMAHGVRAGVPAGAAPTRVCAGSRYGLVGVGAWYQ